MLLTFAEPGDKFIIKRISGKDDVRRHLASLGFVVEEVVEVVSNNGGNMIVIVKGVRIALDKSMAMRIGG